MLRVQQDCPPRYAPRVTDRAPARVFLFVSVTPRLTEGEKQSAEFWRPPTIAPQGRPLSPSDTYIIPHPDRKVNTFFKIYLDEPSSQFLQKEKGLIVPFPQ